MRFDELFMREQQIRRTSFVVKIIILLWHNILSGCLFFSSGVCCLISYSEASATLGNVDALLATGVFAILVSLLHVLEIVFARRLRNLVPYSGTSTFSFQ
ncbi:hypothetical protein B566_EDAN017218 [Ephemera danica]|nr:hypothetical protein B566_EDAN017218 [Ephemera danica]